MPKVFITGGTKRIGFYIAKIFAEAGYDLILQDHKDQSGRNICNDSFKDLGVNISFYNSDLCSENNITKMINSIIDDHGIPDGFIHTSSIFENDNLGDFTIEKWNKHMGIHLLAPSFILQTFSKSKNKHFAILLIDQRVFRANPKFFTYSLSKMALKELVSLLAVSLAPNVRVNGICPGPTLPNIRQSEHNFNLQSKMTPLGNSVEPEEISKMALLLSQSNSITGQVISIDSGQSIDWRTMAFLETKE